MKRLTTLLTPAALAVALVTGGCSMTDEIMSERALESAETMRVGPRAAVVKNVTNFTPALRCMDENLMMYGIRDLVVITEDIDDKTAKVPIGAKDMLISAVSEMTQRSRAIRLIAYGKDSANLIGFMNQREAKSIYQLNPVYGIRGSISQFDESVSKEKVGGGLFFSSSNSEAGIGATSGASASMLGVDLTMMRTSDLTIVPGVTSNNTVAILRSGTGASVNTAIRKFGVDFEMSLARSEGVAQAARNLVNLAAIELFGKLTKTPYWNCLGSTAETPAVADEIDSWYYSLFEDQKLFIAYWQDQMRLRGLYRKPANGVADSELHKAIETYREALGLERNSRLDRELFTAYLSADHYKTMERARQLSGGRKLSSVSPEVKTTPRPRPTASIQNAAARKAQPVVAKEEPQPEQKPQPIAAAKPQPEQKPQPIAAAKPSDEQKAQSIPMVQFKVAPKTQPGSLIRLRSEQKTQTVPTNPRDRKV